MKRSCEDCKVEGCTKMAKYSIKGRALGYQACDDGKWLQTNAERINTMTIEEKAEILVDFMRFGMEHADISFEHAENWLKQEVE